MKLQYPDAVRLIQVPCTGRINPEWILEAFVKGVDGVGIAGCRFGECGYETGNIQAHKRMELLKIQLEQFGIESGRLKTIWISSSEAKEFTQELNEFMEYLRSLGHTSLRHEAVKLAAQCE